MLKYREAIYKAIKDAGGKKINLDEVCQIVKLNRNDVSNQISQMIKHKDYPGIKRYSKRSTGKMTFGQQKAIYDINYRYEVLNEED